MGRFRLLGALPPLTGWVARLYVAYWCVLLLAAIVGPIGTAAVKHGRPGDPMLYLGIDWQRAADDTIRVGNVFGAEARARGVRTGDILLAVNGRAIDPAFTGAFPARDRGGSAALTLRRPGRAPRTVRLTHTAANVAAFYAGTGLTPASAVLWPIAPFLLTAAFQILVATLLFQRRREPIAAMLAVGILGNAVTSGTNHVFWEALGNDTAVSAVAAPAMIALFAGLLTFPSGRFEPRWVWLAIPVLLVGAVLPPSILPEAAAHMLLLVVAVIIVAALVWRFLRDRRSDGAREWRWAIIGFVGGISLITAFFVVLQPLVFDWSLRSRLVAAWTPTIIGLMFAATMICLYGGLALSVLRYRLYDTQAAVSRSVLYGALTLALIAIFAGSEKIIEVLGEEYFGESLGALAGGLGAAFAAVAVGPLHHRIAHWVEHRFRKNLIHLRRDLPPLLVELGETADPATVAHTALDRLAHGLHAARGVVIAGGQPLARLHLDAAAIEHVGPAMPPGPVGQLMVETRDPLLPFRLRLTADGSAALFVGPRPDDSRYDRQERDLLIELAGPLAQALRVAADRTSREARTAARFEALEATLAALRDDMTRRSGQPRPA